MRFMLKATLLLAGVAALWLGSPAEAQAQWLRRPYVVNYYYPTPYVAPYYYPVTTSYYYPAPAVTTYYPNVVYWGTPYTTPTYYWSGQYVVTPGFGRYYYQSYYPAWNTYYYQYRWYP